MLASSYCFIFILRAQIVQISIYRYNLIKTVLYQFKGINEGHIWVLQMRVIRDVYTIIVYKSLVLWIMMQVKIKLFLYRVSTSMNATVVGNSLFACFVNLNKTRRFQHNCKLIKKQQLFIQPTTMYNLHIKIRVFFSLFAIEVRV